MEVRAWEAAKAIAQSHASHSPGAGCQHCLLAKALRLSVGTVAHALNRVGKWRATLTIPTVTSGAISIAAPIARTHDLVVRVPVRVWVALGVAPSSSSNSSTTRM